MRTSGNFSAKKGGLLLAAATAIAGSVAVYQWWRRALTRSLPAKDERVAIKGISGRVEIVRDRWGVPHIYAQNANDLFFAQGYVHAQDRLFQMDTFRRTGLGRISEVRGPSGVPADRVARFFGWKRAAQAQVDGAGTLIREVMAAYCAGVNAFIDQGKWPPEFSLLAYQPEPWQFLDTSAFGTVLAWGLAVNWETELDRARILAHLGVEKALDLTVKPHKNYQLVFPDDQIDTRLPDALLDAYHQALAHMPLVNHPGSGSNNWVLQGHHTHSGRPILANDPHLPPMMPALWYENHLVGGGYEVTGFTMPGIPGVIIGHNRQIAWGFTNAFPDVQDIFIERFHPQDPHRYACDDQWLPVEVVEERIKVRGRREVREKVRYTRHGPVFSDYLPGIDQDLSLCWASYTPHDHLRAVLEMNKATNWPSFRDSLRHWGFPSQNIVYADTAGNIGYIMPGRVPLRKKGDGLIPVPGWTSEYDWQGWIPFEDLPVVFNPKEGFLVTANNQINGQDYPYLLTGEWLPDYRARRIKELILAKTPLNLVDNGHIQGDTVSIQARRFMALALPLLNKKRLKDPDLNQVLDIMVGWDGDMRPDWPAPAIFFGWLSNYSLAVMTQAVGDDLAFQLLQKSPPQQFSLDPFLEVASELALNWLEFGSPHWVGDVEDKLFPALKNTLATLREIFGENLEDWQWGKLHKIEFLHPLAQIPGLGRIWKPCILPVGGDGFTVNQAEISPHFPPDPVGIIASCRLLIDVGRWDNCLAVLPGGQSGNPASAHYHDGLGDWLEGGYHPLLFSREKIVKAAENTLTLFSEPRIEATRA